MIFLLTTRIRSKIPSFIIFIAMASPYFYFAHLAAMADEFALNENSSRHIVQVLRMQPGEILRLTDGKGLSVIARIRDSNKKKCLVQITEKQKQEAPKRKVQIALSLLKNASRFEWFLEKATELGVSEIIPLKCARTEKQQFRIERMQGILESALIQSQQVWMPVLHETRDFAKWIAEASADQKFIGHCAPGTKRSLAEMIHANLSSSLILIGPEGDFTEEEINLALDKDFIAVALGENRLRSETAAVAAAAVMMLVNG
jgi:16S rRNA (uracil1498-N3)-methyltransferase